MDDPVDFRTLRLSGRVPSPLALGLYETLFGKGGEGLLDRDMQDWGRHRIAPWTLAHAGHDVGVGGFRIGFGDDGLEVVFHFVPEVWGQGLASEFLIASLDYARVTLRASRFFGTVPGESGPSSSSRVMEKAGFQPAEVIDGQVVMRLG